MTTTASLYRHWQGDTLLYVGITSVGNGRALASHAARSPWWTLVTTVTVEHHPTIEEARAAELVAIRTEAPLYNIADAPPEQRRRAERLRHGARDGLSPLSEPESDVIREIVDQAPRFTFEHGVRLSQALRASA